MINETTKDRVAQLGEIIAGATNELSEILKAISQEADEQLAAAAAEFLKEHGSTDPVKSLMASYAKAHRALFDASVHAANLRELADRGNTLRHKCEWWKLLAALKQDSGIRLSSYTGDINAVVDTFLAKANSETDAAGDDTDAAGATAAAIAHRATHD